MENESSSQNFRKSTEARPELSTNTGSRHNQEHGVKYEMKPVAMDSGFPASWLAYNNIIIAANERSPHTRNRHQPSLQLLIGLLILRTVSIKFYGSDITDGF